MAATLANVELETGEYHRESETYRAQYDRDTTSPSMAVIASLADLMDKDPTALEPLHATVDTDALDVLMRGRDARDGDISVTFTIAKYAITVYSYGVVAIAPPGRDRTDDPNEEVPRT